MDRKRDVETIDLEASEILDILKNKGSNYIFGCGWMGQKFFESVCALGCSITGFVVTKKNSSDWNGVPIFSLDELSEKGKQDNIFVALRDQDIELNSKLEQIFSVVCPITYPKDLTLIEAKYYLDYFREKNVCCSKDSIKLSEFSFVNPFQKPDDYLLSFVYEAGDLVLPVIYGDYSRIDEGPYEQENTKLKSGDVVLDCGSNIGLFANVAVQKGCKVYAFEPMPDAIAYLEEIKEIYGEQIEICPYALADKTGKATFHVQNFDLLGASMLENNNIIDKDYEVDVTTIDAFVESRNIERVDYIKADIEGSERDMLKGAENTIRKFHPKISICTYHLPDDKEVLENVLKEIEPAYVINHKWKKMFAYVPENRQEDKI